MSLIINKERYILEEGRTDGLGFAFCEKEGDTYTTIQPISPCKEYLNDIFACENELKQYTSGEYDEVYGLEIYQPKKGIFDNEYTYLALKVLSNSPRDYSNNRDRPSFIKFTDLLINNTENWLHVVNHFDSIMGVKSTEIVEINTDGDDDITNTVVLKVDSKWFSKIYTTSAFSAILRISLGYNGEMRLKDYLTEKNIIGYDIYEARETVEFLKKLEKVKFSQKETYVTRYATDIHGMGLRYSLQNVEI